MKTCKYCGAKVKSLRRNDTCDSCYKKLLVVERFVVIRDEIRERTGWKEKGGAK